MLLKRIKNYIENTTSDLGLCWTLWLIKLEGFFSRPPCFILSVVCGCKNRESFMRNTIGLLYENSELMILLMIDELSVVS